LPASQALHVVLPGARYCPALQQAFDPAFEFVFAGQSEQILEPAIAAYLPVVQSEQSKNFSDPAREVLPAGQAVLTLTSEIGNSSVSNTPSKAKRDRMACTMRGTRIQNGNKMRSKMDCACQLNWKATRVVFSGTHRRMSRCMRKKVL
jgi:hypothetical protein